MKKFIGGFLAGAILFGTAGALAATYVATPAGFPVLVNGSEFTSDPPAMVINDRTYLPLRAMGDALGVPVTWNAELNRAEVGTSSLPQEKTTFSVGETWTVDGQWSLTIDSVTATEYRNQFSDKNPAAVYFISYTYKNLGYEDKFGILDGLFLTIYDTVVDSAGVMGYSYPALVTNQPKETPVGATCKAETCIGVDNAGNFMLMVSKYDGTGTKQSAAFSLEVQ